MQDQKLYTLETLATEFGLTPRMARYYVEKLLPEHHKTGRGKLAEYGPDTWNCFAFIKKAKDEFKLTTEQIREVLGKLSQQQIDRVVRGEEEVAIVTAPAEPELPPEARAHYYPSPDWAPEENGPMPDRSEPWNMLYEDDRLRILIRGEPRAEQRAEAPFAARVIRKILGLED